MRECHYAVLGVERDATAGDIRKAYRNAALEWHPDKNAHRLVEATERFKIVTRAHEVLSDPHERQWFDEHREQILSEQSVGGNSNQISTSEIYAMCSTSVFHGFGEDSSSFYSVYSILFSKIIATESTSEDAMPSFPSDPNDVSIMSWYTQWAGFMTSRSFAEKDDYHIPDAPNRRVRRAMEKENKRLRQSSRKAYNDQVRHLVSFVKRFDPRVLSYRSARASELAAQLACEAESKISKPIVVDEAELKRRREADRIRQEERLSAWTRAYGEDLSTPGPAPVEDFYECVFCDKTFLSHQQFKNHEASRKHKKEVEKFLIETGERFGDLNLEVDDPPFPENALDETSHFESDVKSKPKKKKSKMMTQNFGIEEISTTESAADPSMIEPTNDLKLESMPVKKSKKARRRAKKGGGGADKDSSLACLKCGTLFKSRTKLFTHLVQFPSHKAFI